MSSPFIVYCPYDGERLTISWHPEGYEVKCDGCHRAEYAETLEKALKLFEVDKEEA